MTKKDELFLKVTKGKLCTTEKNYIPTKNYKKESNKKEKK